MTATHVKKKSSSKNIWLDKAVVIMNPKVDYDAQPDDTTSPSQTPPINEPTTSAPSELTNSPPPSLSTDTLQPPPAVPPPEEVSPPSAPPPPPADSATVTYSVTPSGDSGDKKRKKTVLAVLMAFFLMIGLAISLILVKQEQDIRQRAVYPSPSPSPSYPPECTPPVTCKKYYCPQGCTLRNDCCVDGTHNCDCGTGPGQDPCTTQCALAECRDNPTPVSCDSPPEDCSQVDYEGNGAYCGVLYQCPNGTSACEDPPPPPPPGTSPSPSPLACAVPLEHTATAICLADGTSEATWSWKSVANAATYELQYDDDPGFGSPVNVTTASTAYVYSGLTNPEVVRYSRVRVKTSNGACTPPSPWSTTATTPSLNCPPPAAPQCADIQVYEMTGNVNDYHNWQVLNAIQMVALQPGDIIYVTCHGINGQFNRSHIRVNLGAWTETTLIKPKVFPTDPDEFYISYTIPDDGTTTFTFESEVCVLTNNVCQWY